MESKMMVKLVTHTPNPEEVVAKGAKLCYSPVGIEGIEEKLTPESVAKFVKMLTDMGHESPLEHINFTFVAEGVSRVLTHQLVRHRIASFSQQSQRYVRLDQFEYIIPDAISKNEKAKKRYIEAMEYDQKAYNELTEILLEELCKQYCIKKGIEASGHIQAVKEHNKRSYSALEKQAIEEARYIFPNACETKIMFTMNARSLLNFLKHRCCNRAQAEIRHLANEMLRQVLEVAPNIFANAGAPCIKGSCPEGAMTCGSPIKRK